MQLKNHVLLSIFLLICIFWAGCAHQKQNEQSNTIFKCEQKDCMTQLLNLKSNNNDMKIEIWTEKKEYFYQEKINFFFKVDRDCYITVFYKDIHGKTFIVFPNKHEKSNFARTNKTYIIPEANYGFEMQVDSKAGNEVIKAIATTDNISLLDINFDNSFFEINEEDVNSCNRIQSISGKLEKIKWSESTYNYKICDMPDQNSTSTKGLKNEEGLIMTKPIPSAGVTMNERADSTSLKNK